jgi:hypothetical protein
MRDKNNQIRTTCQSCDCLEYIFNGRTPCANCKCLATRHNVISDIPGNFYPKIGNLKSKTEPKSGWLSYLFSPPSETCDWYTKDWLQKIGIQSITFDYCKKQLGFGTMGIAFAICMSVFSPFTVGPYSKVAFSLFLSNVQI